MRLSKARVQGYRSIRDSGWFDVEQTKTILVGPNEAGKTVLLQALQQINPPEGVARFDPLRDYPRSEYNAITTGRIKPSQVTVVEAQFVLDADDLAVLPQGFEDCRYTVGRKLDNSFWHRLDGGPHVKCYRDIEKDLTRLCAHIEPRVLQPEGTEPESLKPTAQLASITQGWDPQSTMEGDRAQNLRAWLNNVLPHVDETNTTEEERYDRLVHAVDVSGRRTEALKILKERLPVFVLYNNYFRVRPLIHLEHLAQRIETKVLDDDQYDYGNQCLLKLLGFSARELSDLGKATEPKASDTAGLQAYRNQLDQRRYQLNGASVRLTQQIREVWLPDPKRVEATSLKVLADSQYLKVVVEDELGVEIELDQRSEGFQL